MSYRIASLVVLLSLTVSGRARADLVTDWNQIAIQAAKDGSLNANKAPRALALVHIAIHDALSAIDRTHAPYQTDLELTVKLPISREAAALGAAHYALSLIFPAQKTALTQKLSAALADLDADSASKKNGVDLGVAAANAIVTGRSTDGSALTAEFPGSTDVGKWRPTAALPGGAAIDPLFGDVVPFSLTSPDEFRPAAPPAVNSAAYLADLAEVRAYGASVTTAATPTVSRNATQTQIAKFWEFATHLPLNAIARQLAKAQRLPLADTARLFAQLNIALADSRVAAWDAKYEYNAWRPITAIVTGDGAEDDGSTSDPNWVPYLSTPAHPEYPSGHSTTGAAGFTVLQAWFGDEVAFTVSSESLADTTRAFTSLWTAALENGKSRIYGGIHFQYANTAGLNLGKAVGQRVVGTLLQALPPESEDAGVADAGADDAGVADAGAEDAGAQADAAVPDSGSEPEPEPDAGKEPEPTVDAGKDPGGDDAGTTQPEGEDEEESDGCAVSYAGNRGSIAGGLLVLGLATLLSRRRRLGRRAA